MKKLLVSRDGTLWIGAGKGLASWKDGKLSQYPEMVGWIVDALVEDDEGTVWAGGLGVPGHGRLCAIKGGRAQCSDPGEGVQSIYEDSKSSLGEHVQRAMEVEAGESTIFSYGHDDDVRSGRRQGRRTVVWEVDRIIDSLREKASDILWRGWRGSPALTHPPGPRRQFVGRKFFRSGAFTPWKGRTFHAGRWPFCELGPLCVRGSRGQYRVSTEGGLDRFRDFSVPTFSAKEGFPAGLSGPILAAKNGSLWVGTADRLINWRNSEVTVDDRKGPASNLVVNGMRAIHDSGLRLQVQGLLQDSRGRLWVSTLGGFGYMNNDQFVLIKTVPGATKGSITEGAGGDLWFSFDDALFHLGDGKNVERIPWDSLGVKEVGGRIAADPLQRGLWIGFSQGGIAYLSHGHIERLYTTADGLGEGRVSQFRADREGALWASTEGGLSRIKDGHVATLSTKNGLPCDAVHWSQEDADHSVGSTWSADWRAYPHPR